MLDTSALLAVARGNLYMAAVGGWARQQGVVLLIPVCAWVRARMECDEVGRKRLDGFSGLSVVVFEDLTAATSDALVAASRDVAAELDAAQVIAVSLQRGWAVVTGRPMELLDLNPDIRTETIP